MRVEGRVTRPLKYTPTNVDMRWWLGMTKNDKERRRYDEKRQRLTKDDKERQVLELWRQFLDCTKGRRHDDYECGED